MRVLAEDRGVFGGRSIRRSVLTGAKAFVCALLLCGLVVPAAAKTKSFNPSSAKISSLPAGAQSAISSALGRDQEAYHAVAVRKGYRMKNPRSGLQATFTRQGVRVESGKASWGMELTAFGTSGKLQPVVAAKPEANHNRVEYRRGALTEWYVNGTAGLEQGFTIAKASVGGANETLELALRLTGNMTASVDAAKTGLILKGRQAELRYTGLAARDASGRKLRSWLEVRKGQLLVQVAAAGAAYPLVVDPYIQAAKLTASDGKAGENLGQSVSLSADGSTLVAYEFDYASLTGAAYVFTKSASGWTQAAKLTPSESSGQLIVFFQAEQVGVSGDGSTVVVGSWDANSGQGAVYVFARPSGGWASEGETATLTAPGSQGLGFSVSISSDGSTVAAGALNGTGEEFVGVVYVFARPGDSWASENEDALLLASDGESSGQALGWSVSVSGNGSTVVAGASASTIINSSVTGAAYVFDEPSGGWTGGDSAPQYEDAKLVASDGQADDDLGFSVAVSRDGSTVAAGAPQFDPSGVGAAYVFVKPSGGWAGGAASPQTEIAKLVASDVTEADPGLFGFSVGVNGYGSAVAAGAPLANSEKGAVYIFSKPSGGWAGGASSPQNETAKLSATDGVGGDVLGASAGLSADGLTVAAGAPEATVGPNTFQGAAYVFTGSVPFMSFDASKLRITVGPPSAFALNSNFILGGASNGIDPLTESVTLQMGSLSLTIPAGSFHQNKKGFYVFSGTVDGVSLNVQIQDVGANNWVFKANGSSPNALSITNPVTVTLSIGNDSGTVTETVPIN